MNGIDSKGLPIVGTNWVDSVSGQKAKIIQVTVEVDEEYGDGDFTEVEFFSGMFDFNECVDLEGFLENFIFVPTEDKL